MTAVLNPYEQMISGHYGSLGLKRIVGPNLLLGLIFSILAHSLVVATPLIVRLFRADHVPPPTDVITINASQLLHLRSHQASQAPVQIARTQVTVPQAAIPVAVLEDEIAVDPVIVPTQKDLFQSYEAGAAGDLDAGTPGVVIIEDQPIGDEIPRFEDFVPVEEMPQPLQDFYKQPDYPRMARQAGVNGRVIVQIYVDKTGRVKKHNIVSAKPDNLGFQEEVEKVIDDWRFTPAIQSGKTIGVWVELPINFTISN